MTTVSIIPITNWPFMGDGNDRLSIDLDDSMADTNSASFCDTTWELIRWIRLNESMNAHNVIFNLISQLKPQLFSSFHYLLPFSIIIVVHSSKSSRDKHSEFQMYAGTSIHTLFLSDIFLPTHLLIRSRWFHSALRSPTDISCPADEFEPAKLLDQYWQSTISSTSNYILLSIVNTLLKHKCSLQLHILFSFFLSNFLSLIVLVLIASTHELSAKLKRFWIFFIPFLL